MSGLQDARSGAASTVQEHSRMAVPETLSSELVRHAKYERLIARAKEAPAAATIVVHPCDETSLRGAAEARLITPTLIGPSAKIARIASEFPIDIGRFPVVDVPHSEAAAERAVEFVRQARGELLMKGSLHTDELMRAVTSTTKGLRTTRRISHVFIMDVPTCPEVLFISDAAINIFPDLDAKRDIIQNAIDLFTGLSLGTPRVAVLSAVETVTTKIPSHDRSRRAVQDGRTWTDYGRAARSAARVRQCHRSHGGADQRDQIGRRGRAQIPIVPDLEAGNMLAKNLSFLARADAAGIVLGARAPVILTSRADSVPTRTASCAVAVLYADARRRTAALQAT
jgi:phosphate acetyltransferase